MLPIVIVTSKAATSQLRGGIVIGLGMALREETLYDDRSGRIMNPSSRFFSTTFPIRTRRSARMP
jgi:CO/xanthine dehydrogenase Mo-binding subunit